MKTDSHDTRTSGLVSRATSCRRRCLRSPLYGIIFLMPLAVACDTSVEEPAVTPADHVTTLMGTLSEYALSTGNTYPATALPWGMNFWTPQTGKMGDGWTYRYDAHQIRGFKQTHQPSPWINDYGQFAIMPVKTMPA